MVRFKIALLVLLLPVLASAQIWTFNSTDAISSLPTNLNSSFTWLNANKAGVFSGAGAPGTITASITGSLYVNLTTSAIYICTSSVTCTSVGAGNWVLLAGVGTFSAGNLSPLFTTSVANATSAPALTFTAVTQSTNQVYASPNGSSGVGAFRKVVWADVTNPTFPSLTDGATVAWGVGTGNFFANAALLFTVHGGSRTLNVSSLVAGGTYQLLLTQDSTGGEGLTLGTGCTWKVAGGGGGAITLSTGANAVDLLAFSYDGTNCYASLTKNYN